MINKLNCFLFLTVISIITSNEIDSCKCVTINKCSLNESVSLKKYDVKSQNICGYENGYPKILCCDKKNIRKKRSNIDYTTHKNAHLLDQTICGVVNDDKIAGGNSTEIFEFPWMAVIQYQTTDGIAQSCAGSVISKKYILTAAHCIAYLRGISVQSVILGEHDRLSEKDCYPDDPDYCTDPIQIIEIDSLIPHPQYSRRRFTNDIGLIRLKHEANFSTESVRPICLPLTTQSQAEKIEVIKVTGWGLTELGTSSPVLLQANLKIVNNSVCAEKYSSTTAKIEPQILCAGDSKSDSCQGDSGGPAISIANTVYGPRYLQYGIVSAGINKCGSNTGLPGLYTRIVPYLDWILNNIN